MIEIANNEMVAVIIAKSLKKAFVGIKHLKANSRSEELSVLGKSQK